MTDFFRLRGKLPKKTVAVIEIIGLISIVLAWQGLCMTGWINKGILPKPLAVVKSFHALWFENALLKNTLHSLKLNVLGYLESVVVAVPLGIFIGLISVVRAFSGRYIDALRFLPLTAITGLFIAGFGIDDNMKIQFLAFGIGIYLLPTAVTRVLGVEDVYEQTAYTMGATKWQMAKTVFIPAVLSRIFDDIRVLVAISWTYIIVAEMLNSTGGIGSISYLLARQGYYDRVFGILIVILLIGVAQDRLLVALDKWLFKFKYA